MLQSTDPRRLSSKEGSKGNAGIFLGGKIESVNGGTWSLWEWKQEGWIRLGEKGWWERRQELEGIGRTMWEPSTVENPGFYEGDP